MTNTEGSDMKSTGGKPRYRILWPNEENKKRLPNVTHWIFAADWKLHSWLHYGHSYFTFFTDGTMLDGYQLHKEFTKP